MEIVKCRHTDLMVFSPADDDLAEANAAGINWFSNVRDADNKVCIRYSDHSTLCIGGNQGDQVWFVMDRIVDRLSIKEKISFMKAIMYYKEQMLCEYPVLWNYVWINNKSHYRFLKAIGAEFHEEFTESPITGERFQLFTIRR